MRKYVICLSSTALLSAGNALAGGLWLNEFGDFAAGRSSAGASAGVDEATTIIHNPASSTRLEGSQLFASAGVALPQVQFDIDYSNPVNGFDNGGRAGLDAPLAVFAYISDLDSDRWSAGFSFGGLAGAGLSYNTKWVGRFQATDSELLVLAAAPNIAYRISDKWSVGAAVQVYYGALDLELRVPSIQNPGKGKASLDGSDEGLGFALGVMYELGDHTRLGLRYQSEIELDFDGKLKINVADVRVDSSTELTMAQLLRLSLHHDIDDRLGLAFTLGWDDWSALDNVFVSLPDRDAGLEKNWDDTYHIGAGSEYRLSDQWEITSGLAYDTNPVDARDRTADLPVDRQVRLSVGARYQLRDNLTVGAYFNYMDLGSAKIRTDFWGGEYEDNYVIGLGLNLNWVL